MPRYIEVLRAFFHALAAACASASPLPFGQRAVAVVEGDAKTRLAAVVVYRKDPGDVHAFGAGHAVAAAGAADSA